jgi:hypothetical protein
VEGIVAVRTPREVRFEIDEDGLEQIRDLQRRLNARNLGTAIYGAVRLVRDLYRYADKGYELRVVKGDDIRRLRLPGR